MSLNLIITDHGEQRAEERIGLSKKSVDRIAKKVFNEGIQHNETSGNLKRYMENLYIFLRIIF